MSDIEGLPGLTDSTGKDPEAERLLADLNRHLSDTGRALELSAPPRPLRPVVFVLGPPRSGTTLVSQILSASGEFGTVSNLAARFWQAPALGILLSRVYELQDGRPRWSFASTRGVADGWLEPSEFGYFWSGYFDLGQPTHWLPENNRSAFAGDRLVRAVASMEAAAEKPMAFKNNTWFTFHADLLASSFPDCVLVVCRRDPFFIAQSLWQQRIELHGDPTRWWSVRPPDYESIRDLPPIQQVAAQTAGIISTMEQSLENSGARVVDADYGRVAEDPRGILREVLKAAAVAEPPDLDARIPPTFRSADQVRLDRATESELRSSLEERINR